MYRRSFLHPTNRTGVCGQNLLISGYHITLQFRKETGLVMEKHSKTTSDLIKKTLRINIDSCKNFATVLPAVCETSILLVIAECVPET